MFWMKPKAATDLSTLSDDALRERLVRSKRREKWRSRLEIALLLVVCVGGAAAGGAVGAALGGPLVALIGGGLGVGAVACLAENIEAPSFRSNTPVKTCEREITRRNNLRAAEEALAKKPLESKAKEAFIASLSDGAKDGVTVSKPLRFKPRPALIPDVPDRMLK